MKTGLRLVSSSVIGLAAFGLILFVPAGTLKYWQGWVFIAAFTVATIFPSLYLARTNPAALERRMRAGPRAETRTVQKIIITCSFLAAVATIAFSAFDHRMGWSTVPVWVCWLGAVLVVVGLVLSQLVVIQNGYASASVRVEEGQQLASTGLYKLVRHPMYAATVILMVGIPLALGSYWGLLLIIPAMPVLVFRILDEEKMLIKELAGYREYAQRVRYRLLPNVW